MSTQRFYSRFYSWLYGALALASLLACVVFIGVITSDRLADDNTVPLFVALAALSAVFFVLDAVAFANRVWLPMVSVGDGTLEYVSFIGRRTRIPISAIAQLNKTSPNATTLVLRSGGQVRLATFELREEDREKLHVVLAKRIEQSAQAQEGA